MEGISVWIIIHWLDSDWNGNIRSCRSAVYLEKEPEAVQWLNDSYLYERPSEEQLKNAYADVFKLIDSPQPQMDFDDYHNSRIRRLKKLRVFLANTFGIILINSWNLKKKRRKCFV